jgi:hypothetical protein
MTMLALVLSVGIVIDDAVVVLENIYRFMEEKGMSASKRPRKPRPTSALPFWRRPFRWLSSLSRWPLWVALSALYVVVWLHMRLCHSGFDVRQLYVDADAVFTLPASTQGQWP